MYYATTLHFFAGALTGSIFKVRTLLTLLALVFVESFFLSLALGAIAWLWAVTSLVALQIGYLAGVYARGVLEQAGYASPDVRPRRLP